MKKNSPTGPGSTEAAKKLRQDALRPPVKEQVDDTKKDEAVEAAAEAEAEVVTVAETDVVTSKPEDGSEKDTPWRTSGSRSRAGAKNEDKE